MYHHDFICLRRPSLGALTHEAAHAYHYHLSRTHSGFSEIWKSEVGTNRLAGETWKSKELARREGLVTNLAAVDLVLDHTPDSGIRSEIISRMLSPINRWGLEIYVIGRNPEETADEVSAMAGSLAERLAERVHCVVIYPQLPYLGYYFPEELVPVKAPWVLNFLRTAEDVAYHTEGFLKASLEPDKHPKTIDLLRSHPKTIKKLGLLTEFGFLEHEVELSLAWELREN